MVEIRDSEDFRRILALPKRRPLSDAKAKELSSLLRRGAKDVGACQACTRKEPCKIPTELRPLQAEALHDIGTIGGAYLMLDVGEGKTLISLLAAYVLGARRPLLLLPANLIQKTTREMHELSKHWLIPNNIRLLSYQMLGLVQSAEDLNTYKPDLIIADEVQKTKNRDAAVTRRISRYMDANPDTSFVGMTGTSMRTSILDFAHALRWCLKDGAPVPTQDHETQEWALALDTKLENEFQRYKPGALLQLCKPEDFDSDELDVDTSAARRGFRRRLRETPGVVSSASTGTEVIKSDGSQVGLKIRALRYDLRAETAEHFRRLREEAITPDGWELMEAVDVWRHAKELALGFHQIWDPRPPEEWRVARKAWCGFVRNVLARSRTWDSPEHVAQACEAGRLRRTELDAWRSIKDTFIPNPVPIWHDDHAIRAAAKWMREAPGIVWTEHVEFAHKLSQVTGAKYYGAKGLSSDGQFVDDADNSRSIILSVDANREGRNLQRKWWRNLVVSPEEGADKWQQLIGRTHRPGQEQDVTVDVFLGCEEHARAWSKAVAGAKAIKDTVGAESKLLIAEID